MTVTTLRPTIKPINPTQINKNIIEYVDLCTELKIEFRGVQNLKQSIAIAKFEQFLAEKDWGIFSLDEVELYMGIMAKEAGYPNWVWNRLRYENGSPYPNRIREILIQGWSRHPIPRHVLLKIKTIEETFWDPKIKFYVTNYESVNPDPFLMASVPHEKTIDGIGCYVIDFWDEPGFGLEQRLK